ncbi:hypothetical protein TWF506_005830 [Arthrobotrys conoides]|uniref:Uncharacterized protein n=1 Tax=Arthrobotrys conoides TaxID=74498 RepID=A0AAN8NXB2_9PEZI
MSPSFPFLSLPLELRNEIYKHLLYHPTQPIPYALQLQNPPPYCPVSQNLSIFRVNQQIHAEAARIFYTSTTFVIRLVISDWLIPPAKGLAKTQFQVIYEDPWAEIVYSYDEEGKNWYSGFETYEPDPKDSELVHDEEIESIPSHRYRDLIRHVRVDILTTRVSLHSRETHQITDAARGKIRKLLLPFAFRLQRILSKDAEVEVNLISPMFVTQNDRRRDMNIFTPFPSSENTAKTLELYKELIETAWPYTTGPWRYKLNLPEKLEREYPELDKEVIKWCNENNEVSEEETMEFGVMKTKVPYVLVMRRGRFAFMDEDSNFWASPGEFFE